MDGYKEWARNFSLEWLNELLNSLEKIYPEEKCAVLFEQCGACHYKAMEQMIEKFVGDLPGFIRFMSEEHGQIITYGETKNTLLVDENKSYCVCPITLSMDGKKVSPVICHCSAGMTEKMLAKITGKEVKSKVLKSVLRGDKSCVYEISF